jgi:molecular chaperone GrpE
MSSDQEAQKVKDASAQAAASKPSDTQAGEEERMRNEEEGLFDSEADLEAQIRDAEKRAQESHELLLRVRADMENLRKRTQKDLENAHKYGIEKFVAELLPVMDSMEMGLAAEDVTVESLREGMELTRNMMQKALEKFGVEAVDPMNERFNPDHHQAMSMQPAADVEPNTVIGVMQKGYLLNNRLVRPAMVMVSREPD